MKIDRLIGIIFILLQKDKVTAPELAKRFEVSRRTINRDIVDICNVGIPIVTTQGSGGGISILDSYKIDKALFNKDELQAIFSGLQGIDSISKRSYLANIAEKLSKKNNQIESNGSIIIDLSSHDQKPLQMELEHLPDVLSVDKLLLERAIMNVINNALDYSPQDSSIHISIIGGKPHLKITVTDAGPGFSQEDLLHAKEQFYMADYSRSSNLHFGMGLFITKSIVQQHGGQLDLSNSEKTGGAQVTISIPY